MLLWGAVILTMRLRKGPPLLPQILYWDQRRTFGTWRSHWHSTFSLALGSPPAVPIGWWPQQTSMLHQEMFTTAKLTSKFENWFNQMVFEVIIKVMVLASQAFLPIASRLWLMERVRTLQFFTPKNHPFQTKNPNCEWDALRSHGRTSQEGLLVLKDLRVIHFTQQILGHPNSAPQIHRPKLTMISVLLFRWSHLAQLHITHKFGSCWKPPTANLLNRWWLGGRFLEIQLPVTSPPEKETKNTRVFPKVGGTPKMDGENNGKLY